MFARATTRSPTCLKCQYRLAIRESFRIEPQTTAKRVPRRWQTSAAVALDNEHEDETLENGPPGTGRQGKSKYRNRHWRPAPTTQIGVQVLGKPAEILVLPDGRKARKRSTKDPRKADGHDESAHEAAEPIKNSIQPGVHESLALESTPVSEAEALENIDILREQAEQAATDGTLDQDQWARFKTALSKGFSKKQLQQYIKERLDTSIDNSTDSGALTATATRPQAASDIITKIWGLAGDVPEVSNRYVSKTLSLGPGRRELIMGVEKEWKKLTREVSVKPSAARGWIDIAGPETHVVKALKLFRNIRRRVESQVLILPVYFQKALQETEAASSLKARSVLQDLVQQHEITITKGSHWAAYALSAARLARFERDLILYQRDPTSLPANTEPARPLSLEKLDTVPTRPVFELLAGSRVAEWYRYSMHRLSGNEEATRQVLDSPSETLQDLVAKLRNQVYSEHANTLDYSFPSAPQAAIGHVTTGTYVDIGQALYKEQEPHGQLVEDQIPNSSLEGTRFASRIPFLAQFLSEHKPHFPSVSETEAETAEGKEHLLQLAYIPSDPHRQPKIEIQAAMTASEGSKAMSFTIRSVQLVFPTQSVQVSLPMTRFDLEFTRRTAVPIFEHSSPVDENFAPLLGQIASQVKYNDNDKKLITSLGLNMLLDLDLGCLRAMDKADDSAKTKQRGKSEDIVRYALDTAHWIDKRSHKASGQETINLQHVTYSPLAVSTSQEAKEALRVVYGDGRTPKNVEEQITGLLKGAIDIVETLDKFVTRKTEETISKDPVSTNN